MIFESASLKDLAKVTQLLSEGSLMSPF